MEELKELGLTDNEIKIYLVLLKLGNGTPLEIGEKTGFSRSYVYDALERLIDKQIVSLVLKNNKKYYIPIEPKKLEQIQIDKLEKLQKILPQLEELKANSNEEVKVELHKGTYIYKTLLKDVILTLKEKEEVLIFGIKDEDLISMDKYYYEPVSQYFSKLDKSKIKEKVITSFGTIKLKGAKTTSYKFLPKNLMENTAFEVYGSKVAIFLWGMPHYLIIIENKIIANSYRNQFNLLWKIAKK